MPIRHSNFLYLVVLTRESNLLRDKTSPKNSFFRLIGETHTWTPSLILIAPSHVYPNVDFYIMAKTMDSSIFCPLKPPKHLRFLKTRTVMIILCFGNLSLPSQPPKRTDTSLDLQHHGSYLFVHHTDNLFIRHTQGKKHSSYNF